MTTFPASLWFLHSFGLFIFWCFNISSLHCIKVIALLITHTSTNLFYLLEATHRPAEKNQWYLEVLYMPSGILNGLYWPYFETCREKRLKNYKHGSFPSDGSVFTSHLISPVPFHEHPVKAGRGGLVSVMRPFQMLPVLQDKHTSKTSHF